MHWFWRGVLAVAVGSLCGVLWNSSPLRLAQSVVGLPVAYCIQLPLKKIGLPAGVERELGIAAWKLFVSYPPVIAAALVTYQRLTRRYAPAAFGNQTRCRKCGYILRGITKPRCPECGERI
ncbi:MAG: hypothetical protein JXA69_04515 [Phycisphaerae bacterium]|nr:hypothetical protein [Phycisphaerae bacterium]